MISCRYMSLVCPKSTFMLENNPLRADIQGEVPYVFGWTQTLIIIQVCDKMKYFFSIFALSALALLFATSVHAQVNLSGMTPESADSLQKSRIRYFSPGRGGSDIVWDFSGKLASKRLSQVFSAEIELVVWLYII